MNKPGEPPSGPLKYKVATPTEASAPKMIRLPPPKKVVASHGTALFRIGIVLVMLLSIAVAYWSFFQHLLPLQKESRSMVTRVSQMSEKTDEMGQRWTAEQVRQIRERYREVCGRLFANQAALEAWLRQIHADATPLALDIKVGFGQGSDQELQDLFTNTSAVSPASFSLEVVPQQIQPGDKLENTTPYQRILAFARQLAAHGKRADLAELHVTGGVGSVQRAILVFNLWLGDLGGDTTALAEANTTNVNEMAK
ncbi:MAG TPA: hypothetical protein VJA21_18405 [Verrucomicrobiae bacterium]